MSRAADLVAARGSLGGRLRVGCFLGLLAIACAGAPADRPGAQNAPIEAPSPRLPGSGASVPEDPGAAGEIVTWGYEVVRSHPHDPAAFTQGLTFHAAHLYEGTGRYGASSVRRVALDTGEVLERTDLPAAFFGEGIAIAGERLYQLTWMERAGFVYDLETLAPLARFEQVTDGWGLTWDGTHLIQSDGSQRLWFLDPESFAPVRSVDVTEAGRPVEQINELEYVDGEIWANVWRSEQLLRIDPRDGRLIGRVNLEGLRSSVEVRDPEAVLNGIAHDPDTGRLWVTGKLWPRLFEIRVRRH